jgi:hypothetical protein
MKGGNAFLPSFPPIPFLKQFSQKTVIAEKKKYLSFLATECTEASEGFQVRTPEEDAGA